MFWPDMTAGERGLIEAYFAMIVVSALSAVLVVAHLDGGTLVAPWPYLAWVVACGGLGGLAAMRMVRDRIGLPGPRGIVGSISAAVVATVVIGIVAGSLMLPIYGTMFGPFSLVVTLLASPGLAVAWIGCFVLVHLRVRLWHIERDSIFACRPLA